MGQKGLNWNVADGVKCVYNADGVMLAEKCSVIQQIVLKNIYKVYYGSELVGEF